MKVVNMICQSDFKRQLRQEGSDSHTEIVRQQRNFNLLNRNAKPPGLCAECASSRIKKWYEPKKTQIRSTAQWQLYLGLEWRIIKAYDVTMNDRDDSDLRSPYAGVLCTAAPGQASSSCLRRGWNSGQTRNCQSALSQPSHSSQLCDSDGTIGQ